MDFSGRIKYSTMRRIISVALRNHIGCHSVTLLLWDALLSIGGSIEHSARSEIAAPYWMLLTCGRPRAERRSRANGHTGQSNAFAVWRSNAPHTELLVVPTRTYWIAHTQIDAAS